MTPATTQAKRSLKDEADQIAALRGASSVKFAYRS
jgi:hypothetical protein